MKELTTRQQEIWDMRRPIAEGGEGLGRQQIADRLQLSVNNVSKTLTIIHKKVGYVPDVRTTAREAARSTENLNPEVAGAVLADLSDPIGTRFSEIAETYGIPKQTLQGLVKRMQVRQGRFISQVRDLRTIELKEMVGKKIHLLMEYLDDKVASEASARDLSMGIAQLLEKRQLLRGEPTAIISDHERSKLHELLPALIAEGVRRGISMDGVKDVTPQSREPR